MLPMKESLLQMLVAFLSLPIFIRLLLVGLFIKCKGKSDSEIQPGMRLVFLFGIVKLFIIRNELQTMLILLACFVVLIQTFS